MKHLNKTGMFDRAWDIIILSNHLVDSTFIVTAKSDMAISDIDFVQMKVIAIRRVCRPCNSILYALAKNCLS